LTDITRILSAIEKGEPDAGARLWSAVYEELHKLAAQKLARETPGQTLQPTALVHEAYVRLVGDLPSQHWDGRGHFFAAAAEAMRRILVENARRKQSQKRGGRLQRRELDPEQLSVPSASEELLALDEALERLAAKEPQVAELVKLRYFAGLSIPDAAATMGIAPRTADRWWAYARAWLLSELREHED
jgi:RNA polymerase sigma factor (TIGR02999 family)